MGDYGQKQMDEAEKRYKQNMRMANIREDLARVKQEEREREREREREIEDRETNIIEGPKQYRELGIVKDENIEKQKKTVDTAYKIQVQSEDAMSFRRGEFFKDAEIVKDDVELNQHLKDNYYDDIANFNFKILKIKDKNKVKKLYLNTLLGNPINSIIHNYTSQGNDSDKKKKEEYVIEYLQDYQAVYQDIKLEHHGRPAENEEGLVGYTKYVHEKISEAFEQSDIKLDENITYKLIIIFFKKEGNFYIALALIDNNSSSNMFKNNSFGVATIHSVHHDIINYDYNKQHPRAEAAKNLTSIKVVGYHIGTNYLPKILTDKSYKPQESQDKLYQDAVDYAKRKAKTEQTVAIQSGVSRLKPLPRSKEEQQKQEQELEQQQGGKKTSKKEVLGKMRCIYKIPGDRKEYVKHKGKLITVKDYKMLNKKPKKVADKKPKKVADKKPKRSKK